jgi:hypothetical protein
VRRRGGSRLILVIKVDEARKMPVLVKAASSIAYEICAQNSTSSSLYNGCHDPLIMAALYIFAAVFLIVRWPLAALILLALALAG